ncbi:MAG: acyltransferase [Smithellaceae bacterium]|nr:acyltransferase [Smithellaceae bacterium]
MDIRELLRKLIYARLFKRLKGYGANIILSRGGVVHRPEELELGNNVAIARNFHISARSMKIGNNVFIGPNFVAECDDHVFDRVGVTIFSVGEIRNIAPIIIEDDVWIGANVTLLKGVTVSEGCIIGAGSVVTKTMPPYSICFGVPCRPVKLRFKAFDLGEHLKKVESKLSIADVIARWNQSGLEH